MVTSLPRYVAALSGAALLLSAMGLTTIVPATSAAPSTCRGEAATIVGTDAGEVIVGTDGADVIVALGGDDTVRSRGGADVVCAGAGEDRVHGGAGRDELEGGNADDILLGGKGQDRLRGNAGDDDLDGGLHRDTCFQGAGSGGRVDCENPFAAPAPAPAPTPAPKQPEATPEPTRTPAPKVDTDGDGFTDDVDACPNKGDEGHGVDGTGCPKPKVLAIAFTNLDGVPGFGSGDVLIAKLVDTNGDKVPSVGDTITMGRYPTSLTPGPADFGDWNVKSHTVTSVTTATADVVAVSSAAGEHTWNATSQDEVYYEGTFASLGVQAAATVADIWIAASTKDSLFVASGSPSDPDTPVRTAVDSPSDDPFIDVVINP
jgi:hypothetical protein